MNRTDIHRTDERDICHDCNVTWIIVRWYQERINTMTETPKMTQKIFDGNMKFHNKVLVAYKKYRPQDVREVEKAIKELAEAYPQFVRKDQ